MNRYVAAPRSTGLLPICTMSLTFSLDSPSPPAV